MSSLLSSTGRIEMPSDAELQEADAKVDLITLTQGNTDEGEPFWIYAAIRPTMYRQYMEDTTAKRHIDIEKYGQPLFFGTGSHIPPADVRQQMAEIFGFDENYPNNMLNKARNEQKDFAKNKEDQRLAGILAMLKQQQPPV